MFRFWPPCRSLIPGNGHLAGNYHILKKCMKSTVCECLPFFSKPLFPVGKWFLVLLLSSRVSSSKWWFLAVQIVLLACLLVIQHHLYNNASMWGLSVKCSLQFKWTNPLNSSLNSSGQEALQDFSMSTWSIKINVHNVSLVAVVEFSWCSNIHLFFILWSRFCFFLCRQKSANILRAATVTETLNQWFVLLMLRRWWGGLIPTCSAQVLKCPWAKKLNPRLHPSLDNWRGLCQKRCKIWCKKKKKLSWKKSLVQRTFIWTSSPLNHLYNIKQYVQVCTRWKRNLKWSVRSVKSKYRKNVHDEEVFTWSVSLYTTQIKHRKKTN